MSGQDGHWTTAEGAGGAAGTELGEALGRGFPEYLAVVIGSVVIFLHWSGHHRTFRYLTHSPQRLGQWNGLWLFAIVLTPLVTKVLVAPGAPPELVTNSLRRRRTPDAWAAATARPEG